VPSCSNLFFCYEPGFAFLFVSFVHFCFKFRSSPPAPFNNPLSPKADEISLLYSIAMNGKDGGSPELEPGSSSEIKSSRGMRGT
jgi:hypothetical protein